MFIMKCTAYYDYYSNWQWKDRKVKEKLKSHKNEKVLLILSNSRVPQKVQIFQARMNCGFVKMELRSNEICELLITKKKEQSSVYNALWLKNVQVKKSNIKGKHCVTYTRRIHRGKWSIRWELNVQSLHVWQKEIKATLTFNCCCDETAQFLPFLVKTD